MDFKMDTGYDYNNDILKNKIIKYKPNNLPLMNTINIIVNINLNIEDNHFNIHGSYLEIEFVVSRYAGGVFATYAHIILVNLV